MAGIQKTKIVFERHGRGEKTKPVGLDFLKALGSNPWINFPYHIAKSLSFNAARSKNRMFQDNFEDVAGC